jgi:quercetin dioxygenase-like cupin family protein
MSDLALRDKILELEDKIAAMPQIEGKVDHLFVDGLYARTLYIPAGAVLTGKVHRRDHINFLMKGTIRVMTDEGMKLLEAPQIISSKKGIKRAGFAITDTEWTTIHATTATDVETAEEELVEESRPHILKLLDDQKKIGEEL